MSRGSQFMMCAWTYGNATTHAMASGISCKPESRHRSVPAGIAPVSGYRSFRLQTI